MKDIYLSTICEDMTKICEDGGKICEDLAKICVLRIWQRSVSSVQRSVRILRRSS